MIEWIIFGIVIFLLFPVVLHVNVFLDVLRRKCCFSLQLFRCIKLYSGYITVYRGGLAFHLSKGRAVLLPYNEMLGSRNKLEVMRGFRLISCGYIAEIGARNAPAAAMAGTVLVQIVGEIVAAYLWRKQECVVRRPGVLLYADKNCVKLNINAVIFFTPLVLLLALAKLTIQKMTEVLH